MPLKRHFPRGRLAAVIALVGAFPCAGATQEISVLAVETTCRSCRLTLVRVTTLDEVSRFGGLRQGARVARSGAGSYYVAPTHDPGRIAVFDAGGRYLRSFGGQGSGPGELREVRRIFVGPGDSVYVAGRGSTVHVFDAEGRFARSFPLPARPNDLLYGGRHLLLSSEPGEARKGHVHLLGPGGEAARTVTGEGWALRSPLPFELAPAGRGSFWTAQSDGRVYRLGLHSPEGRRVRAFSRDLRGLGGAGAWERFREWLGSRGSAVRDATSTRLQDVAVDGEGRIWVLLLRENEEWRRGVRRGQGVPGGESAVRRLGMEETRLRYDRFLEVVDPAAGWVVARARLSQLPGGFLDGPHLYSYRETGSGAVAIDVWRLRLDDDRRGGQSAVR